MRGGKPRGAGGQEETQRRQATHTCGPGCQELPIQSPGAPWVVVGVAKEGERLQATSTPSAGLRGAAAGGHRAPWGPCVLGGVGGGEAEPLPGLEEALSVTHRHAGEDGVSSRGTGALPGLTLKDRSLCQRREAGMEGLLETGTWALGMERPASKARTCLLCTGPL